MKFISAQPDDIYFIWQLMLQIRNFRTLGVAKEDIHVIVGYNQKRGIKKEFTDFMNSHGSYANFYSYPDLRQDFKYTSSIRPNILKQHFRMHTGLKHEVIFYHDSDILLSRIPKIEEVYTNDTYYVSDTRNYLDASYIRLTGSEDLLDDMLNIVGLTKQALEKGDKNTGGAQYILKGITSEFWEKVERDSELLFDLMKSYNVLLWEKNYPSTKEFRSKNRGIQAWCADMWAVLWNIWLQGNISEIHQEMDFSWPFSPIEEWSQKSILHYSGNIKDKDKFFKKNEYLNYMPWYDNSLDTIPDDNCSSIIIQKIKSIRKELYYKRPVFKHACVLIFTSKQSPQVSSTYELIRNYILKSLNIQVYLFTLVEQDYIREKFADNDNIRDLLNNNTFNQVLCLPIECLISVAEIKNIFSSIDDCSNGLGKLTLNSVYKIDGLFLETFSKILDEELLYQNLGKFNRSEMLDSILFLNMRDLKLEGEVTGLCEQLILSSLLSMEGIETCGNISVGFKII